MFGYVVPNKPEMKMKHFNRYQAYYCGLCKTIGVNYGEATRMVLNYDLVFLAILLSSVNHEPSVCSCKSSCSYKPFKKNFTVITPNNSLSWAADLNVILAWNKYADDKIDDRSIKASCAAAILDGSYKKAKKRRADIVEIVEDGCRKLREIERRNCTEIDEPTDAFGKLLGGCFEKLAPENQQTAMERLGYYLGRWIYMCDAWDDREKDIKSGSYNIFNLISADRERASYSMYSSLNEAIKAYELISLDSDSEILDNIILEGCVIKTKTLLGGRDEQSI